MRRQEDMIVVEDDPYGALRYEGEALPSIFELSGRCGGPVVKVGTFSKVLSPGIRVGWVIANQALIEKLVPAKQAADLHTSTINQDVALELVKNGLLREHVPNVVQGIQRAPGHDAARAERAYAGRRFLDRTRRRNVPADDACRNRSMERRWRAQR